MNDSIHPDRDQLAAVLDQIRRSPTDRGRLLLIVRRPGVGEREAVEQAELDEGLGLVGDNWASRGSRLTRDGSAHPEAQLTLMSSRVADLVACHRDRWPLAGDQLYVDLDLGFANLLPGTRLALGSAILEVTALPHAGCKKFIERFGVEAMKFVNSTLGREMRLRGVNARVVQSGSIRVGDPVCRTCPGERAMPVLRPSPT